MKAVHIVLFKEDLSTNNYKISQIFEDKKDAQKYCDHHNKRHKERHYYIESWLVNIHIERNEGDWAWKGYVPGNEPNCKPDFFDPNNQHCKKCRDKKDCEKQHKEKCGS